MPLKNMPGARNAGLVSPQSTNPIAIDMKQLDRNASLFNDTPLGIWAEGERLRRLPLGVRVLARRRHLPIWRALALSEIAGFGGLHDSR